MRHRRLQILCVAVLALAGGAARAATFRWAEAADAASFDPYTRDEAMQLSLTGNVYEPLVRRNAAMAPEPALATAWERLTPTRWRFHLRAQVRWQDGSAFSADDVVFSAARVLSPQSLMRGEVGAMIAATRVDALTVDLDTRVPDPILPLEITTWYILPKAWTEAHDAAEPAPLARGGENYLTRHAMGTGPYTLAVREPDRRTVLERNPLWWDAPDSLVERAELSVLSAATTRVAALESGEVDLITGVPPQDAGFVSRTNGLGLIEQPELRTIFLGMDQGRDALVKSDLTSGNPFRDRRVRQALALAIDERAIAAKVMQGHAQPTWLMWAPGVNGYNPALDHRPLADPARARALLAEAGYPDGFSVGLDCPNDRYVMDEAICTALVPMLARIGVHVTLSAQPKARFFAEIGPPAYHTSFYLLGWSPATYDALNVLVNLAGSRNGISGTVNYAGYSNPALDALIDRIATEADPVRRQAAIDDAARLLQDDVAYIPLHQQVLLWAARAGVDLPLPANGFMPLRLVRLH